MKPNNLIYWISKVVNDGFSNISYDKNLVYFMLKEKHKTYYII